MAKFIPYKITESQLSKLSKKEGQLILTTDTGKIYFDKDNTNRILLNSDNVIDFTISGNYITLTKANGTTKQVYIDPLTIGHQISVSSTAPTDLIEGGVWFIIES